MVRDVTPNLSLSLLCSLLLSSLLYSSLICSLHFISFSPSLSPPQCCCNVSVPTSITTDITMQPTSIRYRYTWLLFVFSIALSLLHYLFICTFMSAPAIVNHLVGPLLSNNFSPPFPSFCRWITVRPSAAATLLTWLRVLAWNPSLRICSETQWRGTTSLTGRGRGEVEGAGSRGAEREGATSIRPLLYRTDRACDVGCAPSQV